MPHLILIKHAPPQVDPNVPADRWELSQRGVELCGPLAEALREHRPDVIIASEEPKAAQTAEHVARHLSVPWQTAAGLHEHDRSNVPHMRSAEFISMVELFFRRPDELVLGRETANAAQQRFERAVESILKERPDQTTAIISHGTVIALYVARFIEHRPFDLWRRLQLPSFVVLSRPDMRIEHIETRVE